MQNILVIKHGALGDVILAQSPFQAIRQQHPDAKITLLTTKPFADFLKNPACLMKSGSMTSRSLGISSALQHFERSYDPPNLIGCMIYKPRSGRTRTSICLRLVKNRNGAGTLKLVPIPI